MTVSEASTRSPPAFLYPVALALLFGLALGMRLPFLSVRPMHADEAVHAVKFAEFWQTGDYRYDAEEFHGPILYYATLPVPALRGRSNFAGTQAGDYRIVTALFGASLILLTPLLTDGLGGRTPVLAAAALFAISPAFVFYSDYYIQETPLVFFMLAAVGCGWRWSRRHHWGWAATGGASVGLAIASKETVVLSLLAGVAAVLLAQSSRRRNGVDNKPDRRGQGMRDGAIGLAVAVSVATFLLTDHLAHPVAVVNYLRAVLRWTNRGATAELHGHAWSYYLGVLFWAHPDRQGPVFSEAGIGAFAVVGAATAFGRTGAGALSPESRAFLRGVVTYTFLVALAYSTIPYKTPWCALDIEVGVILLGGAGIATLARAARGVGARFGLWLVVSTVAAHLAFQAERDAGPLCADSRNPYVYAGTAPEIDALIIKLDEILVSTQEPSIQVCVRDGYYWPLPWYLRRFAQVGYWSVGMPPPPQLEHAAVVIGSADWDDDLTRRLSATHVMTGYGGMRIGVPVEIWVRSDQWRSYLIRRHGAADNE